MKQSWIITVQWEKFFQIVALCGEAGEFRHRTIMLRQLRVFYRPAGDVRVATREHGRAPDVAQPAERKRWFQANAAAPPRDFFFGFAVGKIGAENQFKRHARGIGGHAAFQRGKLARIPRVGFGGGAFTDDPGAVRLEFKSGVEHEHAGPAREEGLRARDARRAGTDDTVHGGQWKHSATGLQALLAVFFSPTGLK